MNPVSIYFFRLLTLVVLFFTLSNAALNETHLSLQGYSGIINIPNAMTVPSGRLTCMFTNQTPPNLHERFSSSYFNNYFLTIGFLPHIEITGRFMNAYPWGPRDLSADIKSGYSFSVFNPWLPSIACGVQDISGGAVYLNNSYVVLSEELYKLRVSVGYGFGPDRMNGLFFGTELFLTPFFHLLYDHDNEQTGIAVRVTTPFDRVRTPFSTALMIKNVFKEKTPHFTFSAAISCDLAKHHDSDNSSLQKQHDFKRGSSAEIVPRIPIKVTPDVLANRLVAYGLENVSVGTSDNKINIRYENRRFDHNETDALGIVLGAACTVVDSSCDTIQVTVLRSQTPVLIVVAAKNDYLRFLASDHEVSHLKIIEPPLGFGTFTSDKNYNSTAGRIRFEVSPRVRYFLGTEVGAFDYQLSANIDAFICFWPGASFGARMVVPVWNTANLDDWNAYSSYRENNHFDAASLYQFFNFGHGISTLLSTGLYGGKYFSIINDAHFSGGDGFFNVGVECGYFTFGGNYRSTVLPYAKIQLPLDLSVKVIGGVFWEQDTGIDVSVIRKLNDIDLKFFCKRSKNVHDAFDTFVGAQLCLPLTTRKGMKPWFLSLAGKKDWHMSLSTRVAEKGSLNYITTVCGVVPERLVSLDTDFFNRDRLYRNYIVEKELLLRESWIRNR